MKEAAEYLVWTPYLEHRVMALWNDGLSAREVAEGLGRGFTRNMVLGKLFRLRRKGHKLR
jgi:hypothetical protein